MRHAHVIGFSLLALAAIAPGATHAVTLNPRGLGQVLIYPYYTVANGQDTLVSVVNTGAVGKLVRVRFLEGYDHRGVLDFDLFMSPHDVWTAAISADGAGGARLVSRDHSCTLPALPDTGVAFVADGYSGANADGGPSGIARTREGSIELIALGDIVPGSPTAMRIAHVANGEPNEGTPPGCGEITATNIATDLAVPGDDVFGAGAIVDVGAGTYYPYNADALSGFTSRVLYTPLAVAAPDLRSANSDEATHGVARAYVNVGNRTIALDYERGEDAVSAVFMAAHLQNEFLDASELGAATDWVVTLPTKQYYVDPAFGPVPVGLFEEAFAAPGGSSVELAADFFDQEEGAFSTLPPPDGCGFPCPVGPPLTLSYAVNVVRTLPQHTTEQPSEVFGSTLSTALLPFGFPPGSDLPSFGAGWVDLDLASGGGGHFLPGGKLDDGRVLSLLGLPATGFMAYNVINANAQPGKLANYSGVFRHRSTLSCTWTGIDGTPCP